MKIRNFAILGFFLVIAAVAVVTFTGQPVSGQEEVEKKPEAWSTRCDKDKDGNTGHCEIFQRLVVRETKEPITEFAIGFPPDAKEARGVIILPLGMRILLQQGIRMKIDDGQDFMFKVRYCSQKGCFAFINMDKDLLKKLREGNDATISFKTMSGKSLAVKMSLVGFTKALKEIS